MSVMLFAYVDGSDLAHVAADIEPQLDLLVASRDWLEVPFVVNQIAAESKSGDLPDWDLGLNMPIPSGQPAIMALQPDLEALIFGLEAVAKNSGRDFVVGVGLPNGVSEDLHYIPGTTSFALISKLVNYLHESRYLSA